MCESINGTNLSFDSGEEHAPHNLFIFIQLLTQINTLSGLKRTALMFCLLRAQLRKFQFAISNCVIKSCCPTANGRNKSQIQLFYFFFSSILFVCPSLLFSKSTNFQCVTINLCLSFPTYTLWFCVRKKSYYFLRCTVILLLLSSVHRAHTVKHLPI